MQSAPLTENEAARLKALYDYDILDTEAEKVFDDLTQLASEICHTPIALISLVDPDRQWFKSVVGLDATQTSRDIAFCAHAIHQKAIFEVEDTLKDSRFFDNPLVTGDPKIRFYAGTPLITPDGHAIGTLCAIDSKPHKLDSMQSKALEILGRSVISQMELRRKIRILKEFDKNKTDFLSTMSHELRTPLNAIIGFSRLLLDKAKSSKGDSESIEYLEHIDYSGKRLLGVINSILDINKIEAGMMSIDLAPIDLKTCIEQLVGMLSISAIEKGIDFNWNMSSDLPRWIMADEAKLSQVVINLVNNGIKYTPKHKKVTLRVLAKNAALVIEVKDQGNGISVADQTKLFTKFQQLGSAKSNQGTGLGLAISKGLVELMQGHITVESALNIGTCFTVSVPLVVPSIPLSAVTKESKTKVFSQENLILVVEDNEINQVVIEAMLNKYELKVIFASSGEEALDKITQHHFNLVFMDIHLPGIDGIETSHRILHKQPTLPIIALSADSFEQERMKKMGSIFQAFLTKPIEIDQLEKTLQHYLK